MVPQLGGGGGGGGGADTKCNSPMVINDLSNGFCVSTNSQKQYDVSSCTSKLDFLLNGP